MTKSTTSLVECPVCGEEFDPTAAGGWCTNSECGQWRYEDVKMESDDDKMDDSLGEIPEDGKSDDPLASESEHAGDAGSIEEAVAQEVADTSEDDRTSDVAESDATAEPDDLGETPDSEPVDADESETEEGLMTSNAPTGNDEDVTEGWPSTEAVGENDSEADAIDEAAEEDGTEESVETDDVDPMPAIRKIEEPDDAGEVKADETSEDEEATETEDVTEETAETFECPSCSTELDIGASFCSTCGEDVADYDPATDDEPEPPEEGLIECPTCGHDVGPEDSFCAGCGEDLDAHRGEDTLTECPSCGHDVGPEDSFCAGCAEDLDAIRTGDDGDAAEESTVEADTADPAESEPTEAPETLVLATRGEEIVVNDGDAVGRELRRIVTESGGDQDDAVRIHREHVRFIREDGTFFLVDLGRNPTRLNNIDMEQGDRKPVAPGDELDLSGVVTIEVREP